MKKIVAMMMALVLLISCLPIAEAVSEEREYFFRLSVDGSDTKQVQTGDIITVVFDLYRTDSAEACDMYAMQNEIRYDSRFFQLVESGTLLSQGIQTTDLGLRDTFREFYMNFVSMSGGEPWEAQRLVGSIQLEVIGTSGVSKITNQDYRVSTMDGQDHYKASCQDVTIILSTECTVTFESNGGTQVSDQNVQYGEKVHRPEDPVRKGYHLEGWYRDLDLQERWNFDEDVVQGNMTLYAKWAEGEPAGGFHWIWLLIGLLLLLILLLFFRRKTVRFDTGCSVKTRCQKVKKGGFVQEPETPVRSGRIFVGWYVDEARTQLWNFEEDKVEKNMTLYGKWQLKISTDERE